MNKKLSLPVACIVCVLSLCTMVLTLINNGKQEDVRSFSPPPFEKRRSVACRQYRRSLDGRKSIRMEWNSGHISVEM